VEKVPYCTQPQIRSGVGRSFPTTGCLG
jgi:hypothetical protein